MWDAHLTDPLEPGHELVASLVHGVRDVVRQPRHLHSVQYSVQYCVQYSEQYSLGTWSTDWRMWRMVSCFLRSGSTSATSNWGRWYYLAAGGGESCRTH